MIRDEHQRHYLRCMLEELNASVRPELSSNYARKVVDSLQLLLGRMVAEAGPARDISAAQIEQWDALASRFPGADLAERSAEFDPTVGGLTNPLHQLDSNISCIQDSLSDAQIFDRFVAAIRSNAAEPTAWFNDTAHALKDLYQHVEDSFQWPKGRTGASSVGDNLDELQAKLAAYLRQRYPALPEDPIETMVVATGGQIKRTALFQLRPNDVLPTRLVLRQDMEQNFTGTVVTDEYLTIARVHELGLPVPRPILVEADAAILGGQFMIMTEIEDAVQAGTYFPEERAVLGRNMGPHFGYEMAGVLARLHGLTRDQDTDAGRHAEQQRREEIEQLQKRWRGQGKPAFSLGMELGIAWLLAHPLGSDRPRCLVHGDVGAHNSMTRDGHLVALLDWELAAVGDPAYDLAQARMLLLSDTMPWDDFQAAYIEQGGSPEACEPMAVAYYSIWMIIRHLSLSAGLWSTFNTGARDDAAAASVASHYVDRIGLYTARAVADAIDAAQSVG